MTAHYQYNIDDYLRCSAQQWPNKVAVVDHNGTRTTTFAQLNEFAERLGSHLITLGLEREPILVLMPRSMEVAGCFAGITKSNNFYAHFDEEVPQERLVKTLHTFDPKVIIVRKDSPLLASISEHYSTTGTSLPILLNVEDIPTYPVNQKLLALRRESHIDTDLLYVLFTSGSTGEPKGVSVCHKSAIDYIEWVSSTFNFSTETAFLNQAPFFFDNSITDIYVTFKVGACMHLIDSLWYAMPAKVMKYMVEHKITTIFWVPSVIAFFANTKLFEKYASGLTALKQVLFGGEFMPTKMLNIWRKYLPWCTFSSLYGPTEITDVCTFYTLDREFKEDEIIPIGKACANTEVMVFDVDEDAHGQTKYTLITPDQVGVKGVLFIRGSSLALGYYNNPERSALTFIQNPLHNRYRDLMYNSGDVVAYNEYGELICYGRVDNQIKYHGYRIELGEIETAVNSHQEVKSCACVFDQQIYLFYLADHDLDLKSYLQDKLPSYMIPRHITRLDQFGSTANGKIDRFALKTKLKELGSGT